MAEKIKIQNIKALVELDRIGYKYEPAGEDEVRLRCPAHEDEAPSASLNVVKNKWKCHAATCDGQGDIVSLLALILQASRQVVLLDLSERYDLASKRTINPKTIERFHKKIWDAGPLLKALYERGVTDKMIRKARLGYHAGRITIPVYDEQKRVVNIRRYLPGAPGPKKMSNTPGYGGIFLYQIDQTKYDVVWILGGEIKALVAGAMLNRHKIGAVSATAGEGNWDPKLTSKLKGKIIYVCLDVDQGGLRGSRKVAGFIYHSAQSVSIIRLPLDVEKYPTGDINDYVAKEGAKAKDLLNLMDNAEHWHPPSLDLPDDDEEPQEVTLSDATDAKYVSKKIRIDGVVSSMDTTPYIVPKNIGVICSKDQPNCSWCPIKIKEPDEKTGHVDVTVRSTSQGLLEMINTPKGKQREAIRDALGIPTCKVADFVVKSHYNVTDVRLSPQLHIGNESSKNVVQPAMLVDHGIEMNTPYVLTGRVYPQPRSQQAILLMDDVVLGEDSLESFSPNNGELEALNVFQPTEWTVRGLKEKLDRLYADLETNVTRIFKRRDLHLAMDLCWHSCLVFEFDGRPTKGWVNILVAGDSSQGKSETAIRFAEHYNVGERVECKNASLAGLLGGLQQMGNRWFVSWGVIPTHDRRLVVLEEIKGTDPEVLAKLTDMRSSGIAEIPKIEKRRAFARTRLVFISNPRSGRPVDAYNFGIEIINELMTGLEDIRRLDLAIIVSSTQVNPKEINTLSMHRPKIDHVHTSELCSRLVLWAWTRTLDQIEFPEETTDVILKHAIAMAEKYTESLPLVDRGTMRHKIARLAVALAARTYSTDDRQVLIVRPCHVEMVCKFLEDLYSDPVFGYSSFSEARIHANKVLNPELIKKQILGTRFPADLVNHLLYADEVMLSDICDWCEVERDNAQKILSLFVRKHALYRVKRWYVKTSEFIALLKEMKAGGIEQEVYEDEEF